VSPTTRTRAFRPGALFITAVLLFSAAPVAAHDPGLSALEIVIDGNRLVATPSFADVDKLPVAGSVSVWAGGSALEGIVEGDSLVYRHDGAAALAIRSEIFGRVARGHRQLITVRTASGAVLLERMLDASANEVKVHLADAPVAQDGPAHRFFSLGIAHIAGGYDHLLFLAGMLLVVRGFGQAAAIVTAFSAAHALALILACFGWLAVPPAIVEPLIAASVVWVGIENVVRREVTARWLPAFGFGLVHGLGFASALSELGVAGNTATLAARLAFFNAGIEIGQLTLAALIVPPLYVARRSPATFAWTRIAGSLAVACAGAYWMIERLR
jgi:hypothetical protein